MLFSDILKLSLRMFKARTMRTILTVLGMSVGIAAILFLVSFGYGLQRTLLKKITTSDALVTLDITVGEENGETKLNPKTVETLKGIDGVNSVIPALELRGQSHFEGTAYEVSVVSTEDQFINLDGLVFSYGKNFSNSAWEIAISSGVAQIFTDKPESLLGKPLDMTIFLKKSAGSTQEEEVHPEKPYIITGIVQSEDNLVYLPISTLSAFSLPDFTKLKVKCVSTDRVEPVRSAIQERGFVASSISEIVDQANKVFSVIQIVLMIFGLIALIVSAIGMFNTMTIALLERTEEIGIMKAIGASNRAIWMMFIAEASIMGFLGGLGGVLLGWLEGECLNLLVNLIASRFGGESVDLFYSPLWFVTTIIIFGAFVGLLTGVFPARKAGKIDTLDALRYK